MQLPEVIASRTGLNVQTSLLSRPPWLNLWVGSLESVRLHISVWMCRFDGNPRLAHLEASCNDPSHNPLVKAYGLAFLISHKLPVAERGPRTSRPTIQLWISSYLRRLKAKRRLCRAYLTPCSPSSLTFTPLPWIWIDIPRDFNDPLAPSTALTIERESG